VGPVHLDNAMCDAGTAVPVHGGGELCVVLTVSYEKDFVNFRPNDFIVATIQPLVPYSVHNIVQFPVLFTKS